MKKIILLIIGMLLISNIIIINATTTSTLGTITQGDCIDLYQTCPSCSYVNLTSMKYPNGSINLVNLAMTQFDTNYNYTFCSTNDTGGYFYTVKGDKDGTDTSETIGFEVTPNGKENPSGIVIVIFSAFFLGLLFFAIFSLLKMIALWKDLDVDILDVSKSFGIYFVLFAFYYLVKYYLGNLVIEDLTLLMIKVGAITHIFVPLTAFLASMIFNPLRRKK